MNKAGSFIVGAFTGALVGGVLALLFTPLKGTALRDRLGSSLVHVKNEVQTAAQARVDELNQQLSKLQNKPTE